MARAISYVLPLRWPQGAPLDELTGYLAELAVLVDDVLVVDGSPGPAYAEHAAAWGRLVRHLPPDPAHACANGKVAGVLTGVQAARHEAVVIADDDVRWDAGGLDRAASLLAGADLVRPQNVFDPLPWHARWDSARSLLNRAVAADYPGTFALRRSTFLAMGGYDGNVLFENLELVRTVRALGGREVRCPDLLVRRRPPTARHFGSQRVRQAYDDLAQPWRLAAFLPVLPLLGVAAGRRRPALVLVGAAAVVGLAEVGRRRGGGRAAYPPDVSLFAPLWVLERAACSWVAVARWAGGGMPYAGSRLRTAAHSPRTLQGRATRRRVAAAGRG